uniref:ATP synthase F0 subunit 6 n=1 Tax=Haplobothrium globuliforme TaxID=108250 RepID=A0A8F7CD15_9CEST|nr:ATP synthase F0 subunit 6 [Haplobothrium globuliforme]
MFSMLCDYSSLTSLLYNRLVNLFSYYYLVFVGSLLGLFLLYRYPYAYSPWFFVVTLVCVLFSGFVALFFTRVASDPIIFFGGFVPVGTPLYICPLVCLAETISYVIRPFVLIFRPFINITLGCYGAAALGQFCVASYVWLLPLLLLFFYEVFVALVHWFIVTNIMSFSVDH